MDIRMSQ